MGDNILHQTSTTWDSSLGSLHAHRRASSLQLRSSVVSESSAWSKTTLFRCFHMFQQHRKVKMTEWAGGSSSGCGRSCKLLVVVCSRMLTEWASCILVPDAIAVAASLLLQKLNPLQVTNYTITATHWRILEFQVDHYQANISHTTQHTIFSSHLAKSELL